MAASSSPPASGRGDDVAANLLPCTCHSGDLEPYCPRHTPLPGEDDAAQDREAELHADIMTVRQSLNQLTDHGSQRCQDCQRYRQNGMDALDRLERGMRWMERRDAE